MIRQQVNARQLLRRGRVSGTFLIERQDVADSSSPVPVASGAPTCSPQTYHSGLVACESRRFRYPTIVRPRIASHTYDAAETELRKAVVLEPSHYDAAYSPGVVLSRQGKLEEVRLQLEKAKQGNPDSDEAGYPLALVFMRLQKTDRALPELREFESKKASNSAGDCRWPGPKSGESFAGSSAGKTACCPLRFPADV
jgi:tetratricopeptide (TPR) repeat protein